MPYIPQDRRDELTFSEDDFFPPQSPRTPGELNFMFTAICLEYVQETKGENYQAYNDCIGALEGAKLELYRRHVVPYEDIKIKENGDV